MFLANLGEGILIQDVSKLESEVKIARECIPVTKFRPAVLFFFLIKLLLTNYRFTRS